MRLGRNLVAGLAGSTWTAIVGLAATPYYMKLLGIESFGMIGFFMTLQALMSLLDLGLSPAMNREVARSMADGDLAPVRRLLRSLATLYWLVALGVGAMVAAAAPWLAEHWLRSQSIPHQALVRPVMLMGLAIAVRWPSGLFLAAANGSQRLVLTSSLSAIYATLSAFGAIALLAWYSATLEAYFIWQILMALAYTLALQRAAWSSLKGRAGAKFSFPEVLRVWRYSAAMGLIAVSSVVFTQVDKTLLSRMLGLDAFGRYMLASMVAGSVYLLVTPVFNAIFPRFSALVAAGDQVRLRELYRLGTRFTATLVFPLAMVLAVFAERVVAAWTGNAALAQAVSPVVALLVIGSALHSVMYFPYALQLASGLPRLSLQINVVMIALLVPLTIVLTLSYAELGAAWAWLTLHVFYLLFGTWMTHRTLLRGAASGWLLSDVGLPFVLTAGVACIGLVAGVRGSGAWIAWAIILWAASAGLCVLVSPGLRDAARALIPPVAGMRSNH